MFRVLFENSWLETIYLRGMVACSYYLFVLHLQSYHYVAVCV